MCSVSANPLLLLVELVFFANTLCLLVEMLNLLLKRHKDISIKKLWFSYKDVLNEFKFIDFIGPCMHV